MKIITFSICVFLWTFLEIAKTNTDAVSTCNKVEWKNCFLNYVEAAFEGSGPNQCSNLTSQHPCVIEHYSNCRNQLGSTLSYVVSPYIPLLNRVHDKSCKNKEDIQTCDLSEAKSCVKDFIAILVSGHLGGVCRQTTLALNCLSPVLERCTGVQRYLVALVADEIQLTSDLWCSDSSCRFDIASQCVEDGMRLIDYPVAIEMQSNLICSGVKSSLTCVTNHTEQCNSNNFPQSLSDGFMQLYQFSAAYCGTGTIGGVTSGLPRDLVAPVYLAALTANEWTSVNDMCSIYNATLKVAATERISMATNIESLLTWQQVIGLSLDKLSDICLNNDTLDCKWVSVLENQSPVCNVGRAERCVDAVLLSKLTVDVNLMRSSWQSVCSVAYDMIACARYHTGSCATSDLSRVFQLTKEVEDLVGYECNQLGAIGSQEACDIEPSTCDSANGVHECIMYAFGLEDRCQEQNKIYSCFKEHLHACNSVQKVPAQFYMEWLLNNCTHNLTLLDDDMYSGVSQCKLQYGYNMFNGILAYSDFNTMICTVTAVYRQCLGDQPIPSLATLYIQEVDNFYSLMQQTMCNNTQSGFDMSAMSESEDCQLSETAGEVTLSIEFYSNFPFMSLKDQEVVCRTYPPFKDMWTYREPSCSSRRQTVISDAIVYFDNIHQALCSVSRPDSQRSCDVTRVNMCLEDFGAFTYFATENSDICGKLEETYQCLVENTKACDEATHNALLSEIQTMHSLMGNITCPKMQWCDADNTTDWFPWQREICSDWNQCLILDWMSCFDQLNIISCQSYTQGLACVEQKLTACDPQQVLLANSEISQWIMDNSGCIIMPNEPPSVTEVHRNISLCSSFISQAQDVSKQGLCTAINGYLNCLGSMDQSEVLYVWRGILGRNGQLWRKRLYLDCQIANTETFIVGQDFNPDNITRQSCTTDSRFCLRAITSLAVTNFHMMPLSERFSSACERAQFQYDCVMTYASSCISPTDRYLLTSAEWIREGLGNVGTCSSDTIVHRECSPSLAMECISDLGHVLIEDMESMSIDTVCSKMHSTSMCVNQRTSSCDYFTRSDIVKTFNQVSAIIKGVCTPSPPIAATTSCLQEGEATQCDLEEALICMVPVQAMLLHPNSTWGQICGSIPEMKACVHRTTSGCDVVTMTIVSNRLHRLSHRLNDQCPQIYCEECTARTCIVNLRRNLQYENASLCGSVAEAKQCIYQNAGYCEPIVSESLLREITLLVGDDAYLCEITLPSCLQTFMRTAYQISSYTPLTNVSFQNDYVLGQMCNEASSAFYCVNQHLTSIEGERLQIINSTMQTIGNMVYGKCQGAQLQCYSCVNATSNEECNQQRVQTCSRDMQMCGTVFTGAVLNKGCVRPDLCQNGCNGTMCSMCCRSSLCNQPWDNVILEPATCQPETALYCGFQLLTSLVQNDTINCVTLEASLSCMIQSTQDCMSSNSMSLGIHARDLLTRDVMSVCVENSPVCGCGQCTSMLLLSVVSSPFGNMDGFCKTVNDMYNRTLNEMDLTNCSMGYIQSTSYNLQMAAYMIQGICSMENIDNTTCNNNGMVYSHGASFMAQDGCNFCTCDRGTVACTLMYCPPDDIPQCPDSDSNQAGICWEMCGTDYDCANGQICCSNGCGHVCIEPKSEGTDSCNYGNYTYDTGESFLASDGCNFCYCYDGMVSCTEMYCPSGNGSCSYNDKRYNNGDSFLDEDGCNSCFCNSGNIACTLMYCPPDNKQCPAVDENQVGTCVEMCSSDDDCGNGQLCCSNGCGHVCTDPETEEETNGCTYNDMTYNSGDRFLATDGCNTCFCNGGSVGCTKMYCPTEGICDIAGVQSCINEASLPYLMSMVSGSNSRHVCLSAADLLKCVEPKVKGCPTNILSIVHRAVWWNIQSVQSLCDLNDIVWSFYNGDWQINTTVPGKCSVQEAVNCFIDIDGSCSSYQSMIDCVYNFTTGCLTVDTVPVLFELEHHLEGRLTDCDLVIPEQNVDPLYPIGLNSPDHSNKHDSSCSFIILGANGDMSTKTEFQYFIVKLLVFRAQCMSEFGKSLNDELALMYLRHGQFEGVCYNIEVLVGCLHNISNVQPAGKYFIQNMVESLSNLVQLCNDWDEQNRPDTVTCHHCQGFTDMEMCDSMPTQDCHPNQVCATSLQLDPSTGYTMVTKGCADTQWCHMSHGCNAQFMSCVACCHGDHCNSADNMTSHVTDAPTPTTWRTTTMKPTAPLRTTTQSHLTTSDSYGDCQIYRISTVLTAQVLRLMTFNLQPIYERELMCQNFENTFATVSDHLDPNCSDVVTEHVQELIDWLSKWSSEVCSGDKNDEKCMEAIHCVSDAGNFTDANSTCRSISKAMDCLQTHYQSCNVQGQMSINSTRHILSDMNFVICEPNMFTKGLEQEECVSLATSELKNAKCDVEAVMDCTKHIQKAFYNPFMSQDGFCNISRQGIACIRDNSFNCSMEVLGSMSTAVVDTVRGVNNLCPNIWCPADEQCTLEPAFGCMRSLEAEVERQMLTGNFSRSVCKSITRTHHCIMNATQNCSLPSTQRLFQQFNAIVLLTSSWCNEEPTNHTECLSSLHHDIDHLVNFDTEFVNYILRNNLQMILTNHVISKDFDDYVIAKGMAILGLDISLLHHLENETDIILPAVIGYMFEKVNVDGINLPALSSFIAGVIAAKQNYAGGLNLPGGGRPSNQSRTIDLNGINLPGGFQNAGHGNFGSGLNLPGGAGNNQTTGGYGSGDFGYGLNLPGYDGSSIMTDIDIDRNIENITSLLFRSNTYSATEMNHQILRILNKTRRYVAYMADENSLMVYQQHKVQLCNSIHESLHCVYGHMYSSFMTSSKRQEYVATATLRLLDNLATEMCQEDQCYSCNGLHSNDECNMQPLTTCGPLQVCQARFTGDHYFKGCASALTCDEECHKDEGHCYCCHGGHCNKDDTPMRGNTSCEVQTAVDTAYDLLSNAFVTEENYKATSTLLYGKSDEMIKATNGCYGINLKNFGIEGKRIIKLLEAENCTKNHMSQKCDISGLNTLTYLMFSSYYTTETLENVCSLFAEVSHEVISKFSEGDCCDETVVQSLITVYQYLHPHCDHLNIEPVCEVRVHQSCQNNSNKTSDVDRSKNVTDVERNQLEEDGYTSIICSQFNKDSNRKSNNLSEPSDAIEESRCDISEAMEKCLGNFKGCSDASLDELVLCVQNHTTSCFPMQKVSAAIAIDRITFSCGRNISSTQNLISEEIVQKYHCLQDLAKENTASAPNRTLQSSLCETMNSVSRCLASSEASSAPMQKMYFNAVEDNLNRFRAFICTYNPTEAVELNGNETCDMTTLTETATQYLNFAFTSPPMLGNDVCIFAEELETLRHDVITCSGMHDHSLADVLLWLYKDVKVTCEANLANTVCKQSDCDVTMATHLLKQTGYFLLTTNFNDMVFCQKLTNDLHGVECLSDNCSQEDVTSLQNEMLYIRSVIGTRCPRLTDHLYCEDKSGTDNEDSVRNTTNGDRARNGAGNETRNDVNGTIAAEACNVMQSKMCVNSARLPASEDGLYCSKMMSAMKGLSECVLPKLRGCSSGDMTDAVMFYRSLFTKRRQYCYTDFLAHLFGELTHSDQCRIPQCSHVTASDCFNHFKSNERDSCGNIDEIEQCILYATEGCNDIQQSAMMVSLQAFAVSKNLSSDCLESEVVPTNTSTEQLIDCVVGFGQQMSDILSGNMTGSPSCHLMTSYVTCLENTWTLAHIPKIVNESMSHLVLVAKPAVEIVCKQEDNKIAYEEKLHTGNGNDTCDTEKASYCLKRFSANVLLSPLFSSDGKHMICDYLSGERNCLSDALSECHHDDTTDLYFNMYSLIETLAQLSGVCSPHPHTCSPEVAMDCVTSLGYALSKRSYHEDICTALQQTELCIRQTTSMCDSFTRDSVLHVYEPISCKAYSVCPSAIQINEEVSRETQKSCIDPAGVVAHSGKCSPSVALKCLQDIYGEVVGETKDSKAACRKYESALTCFFNNVNACEDDVTILMTMYYLLDVSAYMDKMCSTTIKHGCDSEEETECNLNQLEDCIEHFHNIEESGSAQERCLARNGLKHCFEISSKSCPRITRMYATTKLLRVTVSTVDDEEHMCDNVHQCVYNYMAYFNNTLSHHTGRFDDNVDNKNMESDLRTVSSEEPDHMVLYQCHARLDELSCIQSHLQKLPADVAMVTGNLLMQMDNIFADSCAVQIGLLPDLHGCNQSCIECLQQRTTEQNDMLLAFVSDSMNISSNTQTFSSSKFCRLFEMLKASKGDSWNVSCINAPEELACHNNNMNDFALLYDKYCDLPCNTTDADICISQLESDVLSLGKEEVCLSYNETLKCLEDSVTSCDANVTNEYFSKAETIFQNTGIICYIMPEFEISYTSTELVLMEGEMSQQVGISVTMMTPVMDSCFGSSCHMEVFINMEEPVMSECSSGQEIPQILMDSCVYIFDVNNTASTHEFIFYPRVDHKVEDARNVKVNVIGQLWEDGSLATGDVLATVTMALEDRDSTGVCYLISEPTIRTFDSLLYYSFYQGEYIVYQHDALPEKVNVGFQQCRIFSSTPCPCVTMIQSGDDTFVIDRCRRFGEINHALEFKVFKNNDITEQTKVYTLTNRNFFQFVLPSGTIVNVRSGRTLLDVWIKPSAIAFGHTTGLCGTYDDDMENDLTYSDESVEALSDAFEWRGSLVPFAFVTSWRPENTLFEGVQSSDDSLPSELSGKKCACTNSTCTPTDIVETCDFVIGEEITSNLELYTQIIELQNRRKRQAENVWDTIDYNPGTPPDEFPIWPTTSGITEAEATQSCEAALRNHASWDICSEAVNTTSIVSSCVTDILLSDTEDFVSEFVEDMKVQCKVAVLSDPSIAARLNQTQEELVSTLLTLTCLNDCSNHGQCVNDVCQCDTGYQGDDCSGLHDTAPEVTSLSESIYSGESSSGLTVISRQVTVYGSGFVNSDSLTCHVEQVQVSDTGYLSAGVISNSTGTFLTSGTLLCDLSGSLPLTGLLLSVSNNGLNQSNGVMYIFQDPICYDCDPSAQICNMQPTSCVIEGQCYGAGIYNPTDPCLLCNPVTNEWIFKPSSTCVTTSTSTTSSSTSSTTSTTPSSTTSSTDSSSSSTSSTSSTTSSTTSSSTSSTSSSTSSTSPSPSTPSTTPSSTPTGEQGGRDGQEGDQEDQQTFNIVIITGACVIVLIVIVTAIFAFRLRRKDKKASELGSSLSSSDPPKKQGGRTNAGYNSGEAVRPIAGDPVIQPRRITPLYSANFNTTEGLEGRSGAPAIYEDDPGLHTVNIEIFDEERKRGREHESGDIPVQYDPDYDNVGLERRYTIPRPVVASQPADIYPEARRQGADVDYDNVTPADRRETPMPDYYEDDGLDTVTRM